jgi:hypothetical protein
MKGDLHFSFLGGIILVLLVVLIGSLLIGQVSGFDAKQYFGIEPVLDTATTPGGGGSGVGDGTTSGEDIQDMHIFSPSSSSYFDLSEIACYIGDGIFNDFKVNGYAGMKDARSVYKPIVNIVPFESATGYLIVGGLFYYDSGRASGSDADQVKISAHPECYLCRVGTTPIYNLDGFCVGEQLKGRTVGTNNFCTGPIPVGGKLVSFGESGPNLNSGMAGMSGWSNHCNNGVDRMNWFVNANPTWPSWQARYTSRKYASDGNSNTPLRDGYSYAYGVFWIPDGDSGRYDIVFSQVPDTNPYLGGNLNDVYSISKDNTGLKADALGINMREARSVADFIVNIPAGSDVPIAGVLQKGLEVAGVGVTGTSTGYGPVIVATAPTSKCNPCSNLDACIGMATIQTTEKYTTQQDAGGSGDDDASLHFNDIKVKIGNLPIQLFVSNGNGDNTCSLSLKADRYYRVIINRWAGITRNECGWLGCKSGFSNYDRSIIIQEIVPITITTTNNGNVRVFLNGVFKEDVQGTKMINYAGVGDSLRFDAGDKFVSWTAGTNTCTNVASCKSAQSTLQDSAAFSITYTFSP